MKIALPMIALVIAASPFGATLASAQAAGSVFNDASPLPFHAPDFSKIKDTDYQPAILAGIAQQQAEIDAIAANPAAPTFENTIEALEKSGQMLTRVIYVFSALTSANTNDTLDKIDSETAPKLAALRDSVVLNDKLFARVKALYDQRAGLNLSADQLQVLTLRYEDMVRNGALLSAADKEKLKAVNGQISSLQTDFGQKLTAGTKDAALVVKSKAALAGMSPADIAAAAKAAADRKLPKGTWLIPLQNTTQQPALASLSTRATRQALFAKSWSRSEQGNATDTRALIQQLAQLRAQKAKLLGYPDFASYALSDQMARTRDNATGFLNQMVPALAKAQHRDAAELSALIKSKGGKFAVTPTDWDFYAEKLRKAKF
ncbi:MAG: dipeptidyl carboxypeptidase II, partial [Proteobacteria bacterium]|nr:dipeptidyl carboxypeptidase II [Pseudomonadota bacterium]